LNWVKSNGDSILTPLYQAEELMHAYIIQENNKITQL